jgi:hypothetical protein
MVERDQVAALFADAVEPEKSPASPAVTDSGYDRGELKAALAGAVHILSMPVCKRYRVTPLLLDECDAVSGAVLNLAQVYGLLDKADPRIMAWLTVGGVAMQIAGNRQRLPEPETAADAAAA